MHGRCLCPGRRPLPVCGVGVAACAWGGGRCLCTGRRCQSLSVYGEGPLVHNQRPPPCTDSGLLRQWPPPHPQSATPTSCTDSYNNNGSG